MMSRIKGRFEALAKAKRKALIPYITAGDPHPSLTVPLMQGLVEAGSDIIELGVPFSDPMADGPVVQRAGERALKHGVGLKDVLGMVKDFRKIDRATTHMRGLSDRSSRRVQFARTVATALVRRAVQSVKTRWASAMVRSRSC